MFMKKVPCMVVCIEKIGVWNESQTMWDSFQTFVFNTENLSFIVFGTPHAHAGSSLG